MDVEEDWNHWLDEEVSENKSLLLASSLKTYLSTFSLCCLLY